MKPKTLFTISLIIITSILNAQIINVPEDFATIQEGIDAAVGGDTVLIADGTYFENFSFKGKAITVASKYIIDGNVLHTLSTIIDGSQTENADTGSVVRFVSGEDTTSVLYGLTVKGGSGTESTIFGGSRIGGGIFCFNSGAKLEKNRIIENNLTHEYVAAGAGIGCYNETGDLWLVITDNDINNNTSIATGFNNWRSAAGGGMYISSNAKVNSNVIHYNQCVSTSVADGAGAEFESVSEDDIWTVYFTNNNVQHNTCDGDEASVGGGLNAQECEMFIEDNIFKNNKLIGYRGWGAAISIYAVNFSVETNIENNEFSNNIIDVDNVGWGAAIYFDHPNEKVEIIDNYFSSNLISSIGGYGTCTIYYSTANYPSTDTEFIIDGNTFSDNHVNIGGGVCVYNASNVQISNNLFSANVAVGTHGGAVFLRQLLGKSSTHSGSVENQGVVISNNTFVNNEASRLGGAIYNEYRGSFSLATFNNIFWENAAGEDGDDIYNHSIADQILVANSNIDTDNISGSWTGSGNINEDPMLENDNVHLDQESPCIDQGIESIVFENYTLNCTVLDIDEDDRPLGDGVDIGADEYIPLPETPVALMPSEIGDEGFTAEWEESEFAEGYYIDVAWDEDFQLIDNDYDNLDVGDVTSYQVTGLVAGYPFYYRIRAYNSSGTSNNSNVIAVISVGIEPDNLEENILLVYPNPFTSETTLEYILERPETVKIIFFNQFGKQVDVIEENQPMGLNRIEWTAKNLADGIYYFRLEAGEHISTGKVVLVR